MGTPTEYLPGKANQRYKEYFRDAVDDEKSLDPQVLWAWNIDNGLGLIHIEAKVWAYHPDGNTVEYWRVYWTGESGAGSIVEKAEGVEENYGGGDGAVDTPFAGSQLQITFAPGTLEETYDVVGEVTITIVHSSTPS